MSSLWTCRSASDAFRPIVALAFLIVCHIAPAHAQSPARETPPFRSEWLVIGGVGGSIGAAPARADREMAFQSIEWGRIIGRERGPGPLKGRLEMLVGITPVFVAFQSSQAEGAGFSPLMFRWNFRSYGAVLPFVEIAGGVIATNHDVPEGTTRLNFLSHAGAGARVHMAGPWGLVLGYRFQHLSNGSTAPRNPGINSNVGYMGIAYRR
jgi:hypothetical protein